MTDPFTLYARKAKAELTDLRGRVAACTQVKGRPVVGSGNPMADIVVAKCAPDSDEEASGLAFAGRSGEVISKSADRLGLSQDALYGTNLIKCKVDDPGCGLTCEEYFAEELDIVAPRLVLAMGEAVFAAACRATGLENHFVPGTVLRRPGRPTVVATLAFDQAMVDEEHKKRLWQDLKLLAAEYMRQ